MGRLASQGLKAILELFAGAEGAHFDDGFGPAGNFGNLNDGFFFDVEPLNHEAVLGFNSAISVTMPGYSAEDAGREPAFAAVTI